MICPSTGQPIARVSNATMPAVRPNITEDDDPTQLVVPSMLSTLQSAGQPSTGTLLAGRYRLRSVLARGGMGVVYDGYDEPLDRPVAIKVLAPESATDQTAITRFHSEIKTLAAIAHPRIVTVFDAGELPNGAPFLVMERLEGEPLSSRMKREGPMPMVAAVQIARQILEALAATHSRGILHRDLKPQNVFLVNTPDLRPSVRVLDYGVARRYIETETRSADVTLTRAGRTVGTPQYMAFEQLAGRRDLDPRADLYAVGVLLYEMLAGTSPWTQRTPVTLALEMRSQPLTPLRTRRAGVPPWLEAVVHALLSVDREQRPPDARTTLRLLRPPVGNEDPTITDLLPIPDPPEGDPP
ncbi:MAG: serine/threonine-protein kinase [Deltaproteobacteria bacterium]|nr:serine/threonine-protein kinase [Deltaproteobacteria bacterium]